MKQSVQIHHLHWEGPYSEKDLKEEPLDPWAINPGIYQVYGTHPTEGGNSLLYIGMSNTKMVDRRDRHQEGWLDLEYDEGWFYFGRLVAEKEHMIGKREPENGEPYPYLGKDELNGELEILESLLIFYTGPPYNSRSLQDISFPMDSEGPTTLVLFNTGRMGKLPVEVSTLWWERWYKGEKWSRKDIEE